MNELTPRGDDWWLYVLLRKLHERNKGTSYNPVSVDDALREKRPGLDMLNAYLIGRPPLPKVASGWQEAVQDLVRLSGLNLARMSVVSASDRMVLSGFTTAVEQDADGDQIAAQIVAENDLQSESVEAFSDMLGFGDGYLSIGPPLKGSRVPVIRAESPRQAITAVDKRSGATLAGVKHFRDEWDGSNWAVLYLPGRARVAKMTTSGWEWQDSRSGAIEGLDDEVALVRMRNNGGVAEFEPHLNVIDRVIDGLLKRIVITTYQAYKQRFFIGGPSVDEAGEPIDYAALLTTDPGSIVRLPEEISIKETTDTSTDPLRNAIKDDVMAFSAVTATPLYYMIPDAANGSAEGAAKSAEANVFRVEDRRRRGKAGLAQLMSMAFKMMGEQERAQLHRIDTQWLPAERHSLVDKATAAAALNGILPNDAIMTDVLQYSQAELPRLKSMRMDDVLRRAMEGATPGEAPPKVPRNA